MKPFDVIMTHCCLFNYSYFLFFKVTGKMYRLWDVRTGKIVQTLDTKSSVTSSEVSQDGRYITTADGSTVKFWDAN
jgi:WD40 repeat protein